MSKKEILAQIKNGLIVSCQALSDEPLHGADIMRRMAQAAMLGGAAGIRANTIADITAIMEYVPLPIIGIIKSKYPNSDVYITPTRTEVDALARTGVHIIAMDATDRPRPDGIPLEQSFPAIKRAYPDILFMADCSTFEDGMRAAALGFDLIGTTMCGYTEETKGTPLPSFALIERLVRACGVPVVAEGGIKTPEEMRHALDLGAHCCVVGGAITRPVEITRRFTALLPRQGTILNNTRRQQKGV